MNCKKGKKIKISELQHSHFNTANEHAKQADLNWLLPGIVYRRACVGFIQRGVTDLKNWFVSTWRRYTTLICRGCGHSLQVNRSGCQVVDPVGPKCLQTARCCGSGIQVQRYNSEELRRFPHLMTELFSRL